MAEESKKSAGKVWLIGISILLFLINALKIINNPCSEVPILTILFNIIIFLTIIILLINKDEMELVCYFQNHFEKYK